MFDEISAINGTQRVSGTQRVFGTQHSSCTQHVWNNPQIHSSHTSKSLGLFPPSPELTRKRPNTGALFSVSSVKGELLSPSLANCLRSEGISKLLKLYPNQRFVDTLLSIVLHGARIGYEGPPSGHLRCPNHSTAFAHPVDESISNGVRKGQMKQISSLPVHAFCSPIGLVPKTADGVQIGLRVIFDLSSPEGSSVR